MTGRAAAIFVRGVGYAGACRIRSLLVCTALLLCMMLCDCVRGILLELQYGRILSFVNTLSVCVSVLVLSVRVCDSVNMRS